ncbi:MAG: methylated-DNA--[protein]-cysteine S-methyltransferase [Victivallaceae bacterium]
MSLPKKYSNGKGLCISCSGDDATKIIRMELDSDSEKYLPPPGSRAAELMKLTGDFIQGKPVTLPSDALDLSSLSAFQLKVLQLLRKKVPRGKVVAYGTLAAMAGSPAAARAIGSVMRKNPFPLFFPCHRVIASNATLGGFMGVSVTGCSELAFKKQLLQNEGLIFLPSGRISSQSIIKS